MLTRSVVYLVDVSRRKAFSVVLLALLLALLSGWYAVSHFSITTDVNQLLADDLPWRRQEKIMEEAFPQKVDTLVVVVDGTTPAIAEGAAQALADKLQTMPDKFSMVVRPDAIPFFRQHGLLFLSKKEIEQTLDRLTEAQPLLGTLVSDPSLRGLFGTIGLMAQGFQYGQTDYARLDQPFDKIADTIKAALDNKDLPLPLESLMASNVPTVRELRKYIIAKPILDYSDLSPGQVASDALRQAARDLALTPEHGVHVRLTGPVALNDEEFSSVAHGTGFATLVSGLLVFLLLLLALKSFRLVLPILATLIVGLLATTAFALLAVGSLNLISVAFAVMFIGIAVDFGIQFGVRFRDQHHQEPDFAQAMKRTANIIALPLAMAAGSTAIGFLAFIPTDYRGVSELGLIAGAGMLIAFVLNITLLPALLQLTKPPAEPESIGCKLAAPLDRFLAHRRRAVLIFSIFLAILGAIYTTRLRFDFDPIDLKDPQTESVSTLLDIMNDPEASSYTIDILRPSLEEAKALADKIEALPEVDHVVTLASFVPEEQDAKIAMIADAANLLGPTLALPLVPAPTDEDVYASFAKVLPLLQAIGENHGSARKLADALDQVIQRHNPALLARLQNNLVAVMQKSMQSMSGLLTPTAVTASNITDDLKRDWITKDGRALVEVYPKGDPRDYHTLIAFTDAVRSVASDATGAPISIRESGHTVTSAFVHAGINALCAIALLAWIALKRLQDVVRLLTPLLLAGILTLATITLLGIPLNFANIIALPLLLSLGVSYAIYFVSYWKAGFSEPLQSSMARAVLFSAATVLVAFGSLSLSSHPGTASMGELLTVALLYSLLATFFVLPCLLGPVKRDRSFN